MKKKGFTLIELLAVIIILAVIALIATPIVLNVVNSAKREADKNSAYGLLDAAKLYYAESLLDLNKQNNTNGTTNLIDEIKISGDKPDSGIIYVNDVGEMAIAVVYGEICYKKGFTDTQISESEDVENCTLGVEETPVTPSEPSTPEVSYKCIRATELHSDSKGDYGNLGESGTLSSGDAFDCDVDGNGYNHRFYYVTDLASDSDYAVLIYYNNTTNGVADNTSSGLTPYDNSGKNYQGPLTGKKELPTDTLWDNVSLSNNGIRSITNENNETTSGNGTYDLPITFSYEGYAARLLTYQEVYSACGTGDVATNGYLEKCTFLMENTKYSSSTMGTAGIWLETPESSTDNRIWYVSGSKKNMDHYYGNNAARSGGIRPVIEVPKEYIEIEF